MIGIKDNPKHNYKEIVKKQMAIEIILNILIGKSSRLFEKLYNEGLLLDEPSIEYEFSKQYAHVLIAAQSKDPPKVNNEILQEIERLKKEKFNKQDLERSKKRIYGAYITEYNNVSDIGRMFASDFVKDINSFEYIEKFDQIDEEYLMQTLNNIFQQEKTVLSVIKPK